MSNYINISNSLLDMESKDRLSVEELYLFSYLWTERTYENRVKTSIDFMVEDVKLLKKKADNKKRIIETFGALKEKELINVEEKGKMLIVTFAPHKEEGYTGIPYSKVEELDPTNFYIYTMTAKWSEGANYSYAEWQEMLGCSDRHAKRIIKKAVEDKVIYKLEGDYTDKWASRGQLRQDVNTYSVKPFLISVKEEKIKKEVKPVKEVAPTYEEMEFADYNVGNWFDMNKFANDKDYDEYLYRKEQAENGDELAKKFVKHCESRIDSWLKHKNEKVRNIVKEKLEKAEAKYESTKKQKEQTNAMADNHVAQLNGDYNYDEVEVETDDDWAKIWYEDQ